MCAMRRVVVVLTFVPVHDGAEPAGGDVRLEELVLRVEREERDLRLRPSRHP